MQRKADSQAHVCRQPHAMQCVVHGTLYFVARRFTLTGRRCNVPACSAQATTPCLGISEQVDRPCTAVRAQVGQLARKMGALAEQGQRNVRGIQQVIYAKQLSLLRGQINVTQLMPFERDQACIKGPDQPACARLHQARLDQASQPCCDPRCACVLCGLQVHVERSRKSQGPLKASGSYRQATFVAAQREEGPVMRDRAGLGLERKLTRRASPHLHNIVQTHRIVQKLLNYVCQCTSHQSRDTLAKCVVQIDEADAHVQGNSACFRSGCSFTARPLAPPSCRPLAASPPRAPPRPRSSRRPPSRGTS